MEFLNKSFMAKNKITTQSICDAWITKNFLYNFEVFDKVSEWLNKKCVRSHENLQTFFLTLQWFQFNTTFQTTNFSDKKYWQISNNLIDYPTEYVFCEHFLNPHPVTQKSL